MCCVSFRMGRGRALTAAGPRGRQCRRPAPLALCSRAQAPRAGGLGAAFRFGWGGGGSRRRQAHEQGPAACGAFGDAALPRWARGAAGVRGRRCLPCGQRRCRVARRIMACRGRERGFRSGLPIREIYQRAGERGNGPHPAGDGDTRHLADRTRLLPAKPSASSYRRKLGALQGTPHCPRFAANLPMRASSFPRLFTANPRLLRPVCAVCGASCAPYGASRALYSASRAVYGASHAVCGVFRALYSVFRAVYGFPTPFAATPCLFTAYSRL